MRTITSTQNPAIRQLRELKHGKARQTAGLFLAEGAKLAHESVRDARVQTLLVDEAKAETYAPLLAEVSDVICAPAHVVASVCDAQTPQGICAAVSFPLPFDLDRAAGALLVLDGVQDPGNVGAMLRTAEAAGFAAALLSPACADAFSPKAVRATMGSIFRLPLWRGALPEALGLLVRRGFLLVSSELGGMDFREARYRMRQPMALLVGSEGAGVSAPVSALADLAVALPMRGHAESLNAAVAAGILMYGIMEEITG